MVPEFEGTTNVIPSGQTEEVPGIELVVIDGPDRGKRVRLHDEIARVGKSSGATLELTDPTVSRLHCELTVRRDGVRLVDSGSTNGTFVGGCRVRDIDLRPGTIVGLGATSLRIELSGEASYVELSTSAGFGELRGRSREMRRIYSILERAARTDATVLISGETGTGKELVAQAIHDASKRASGPFMAIDCGAIPENLIESELFGHVRGAFSGAVSDRKGIIEEADGGSVFFDEIGELPMTMQPKLLRALETRQVRRVGSNQPRKVDVRVLAATNRSLASSVNQGSFREDLYYRLAVIEIELPPLRARREDIPTLAAHFIERFTGTASPPPPELLSTLLSRAWPGNVRELRNFIERSLSLGWPDPASIAMPSNMLPSRGIRDLVPVHLSLKEARIAWMAQFESVYVRALLERTHGNVTKAAELAGVTRRFFQRTMARNGIRSSDISTEGDDS